VGWVFIALGVGGALIFQHADALIFGAFFALVGVWVLTVKEQVK
jgi:hypothetical protein